MGDVSGFLVVECFGTLQLNSECFAYLTCCWGWYCVAAAAAAMLLAKAPLVQWAIRAQRSVCHLKEEGEREGEVLIGKSVRVKSNNQSINKSTTQPIHAYKQTS